MLPGATFTFYGEGVESLVPLRDAASWFIACDRLTSPFPSLVSVRMWLSAILLTSNSDGLAFNDYHCSCWVSAHHVL